MSIQRRPLIAVLAALLSLSAVPKAAEARWYGWENLGGVILEEPDCVSWGADRIDCFARGTNRAMYHRWWNGSSWGGWENLGGVILDKPECVSWGPNRIDCFARGTNASMYHRWWNGSSWGGWENLGGQILETPSCVSWGPNRIDCFARGTNRAMYHRWWNGSSWGGWENLGGVLLDRPECVSWGPNRIDCFARGTNRAMYHRWWNGSSWGGWENLGGVILETPECTTWGPNRIDCFARGTNAAMYHRWWNGSSWGGWENLGGVILEAPDCTTWSANRIDCFARGTNRAMYHRWWNGSSWGGWENLGGVILEQPNCVSWGPNRIDCFARGTNAAMYHRWWNGATRRTLTVSRHDTVTLSNATVDSILSDASDVLQVNDGTGDVACAVELARSGNVGSFATGDGSLDTSSELQAVFALPGNVKVVDDVNYCANQFNSSYIGCGQTPGTSFITERFTASQEGILWAHEFGHNQGLPHRDTSTDNVMYRSIGSNRLRVNATECAAFRGSSPAVAESAVVVELAAGGGDPGGAGFAGMVAGTAGEEAARSMPLAEAAGEPMDADAATDGGMPAEPADGAEMPATPIEGDAMPDEFVGLAGIPVEEFVTQIYFHGLPLDRAATYSDEDVDVLLRLLDDPDMVTYHENVALTLGMIGSERAVEPLIAYTVGGPAGGGAGNAALQEAEPRRAFKGRVGAIIGLGYLANQTGSQAALGFLQASVAPAEWDARGLELGAFAEGSGTPPDLELSRYAIIALGLSGRPEAAETLRALAAEPATRGDGPEAEVLDGAVAQGLELFGEIEGRGLLEYYGTDGE